MINIQDVTQAYNGVQAMEFIEKNPTYYDAVLTDNNMPEMNGI